MIRQEKIEALLEIRNEISRVNQAAGQTVFNPAATDCVRALIEELEAGRS